MKYGLRSLMIGVTLFCVLLGGRIEYLRRWAVFHEDRAYEWRLEGNLFFRVVHQDQAELYRNGMLCPWKIVDDPYRGERGPGWRSGGPTLTGR
jgi:hypothetical protein